MRCKVTKKTVRETIYILITSIGILLMQQYYIKSKKQRSLHYPFGNSTRNAVIVMREIKMVLSTL